MNKFSKENNCKSNKIINYLIYGLIIISIVHLIWYIFIGSKGLMNSDSSFIVDYSLEQINSHSFFPKNWVNINDFWVYSLIPLMTVFIKFGFSLFFSRQLSVFIQTFLMFAIIFNLFNKQLDLKNGLKVVLLLLLSGVSGQFFFEIFGDATYGSIVFYIVLEIWLFVRYLNNNKKINLVFFLLILILLTSCSLRFPIYIGAPFICYLAYMFYNDPKNKRFIYIALSIVFSLACGYMLNKYLSSHLILRTATTNNIVSNAENLSNAIHNSFFNYLWICGATNINVYSLTHTWYNNYITSTSPFILIIFIKFLYSIFTLVMPFILFKKFNKMNDKEKFIHIYCVSVFVLILFFLLFGGMWNWYRYITPVLFMLNLLFPLYYKYFFSDKFKNIIVFNLSIIIISLSSLFLTFTSWYDLNTRKVVENPNMGLVAFLEKNGLKYGYYNGLSESNVYRTISNDKIQITRILGDIKLYYLNSTEWFTEKYYNKETFVIRYFDTEPQDYEKYAIKKLEYGDNLIFVFKTHSDLLKHLK